MDRKVFTCLLCFVCVWINLNNSITAILLTKSNWQCFTTCLSLLTKKKYKINVCRMTANKWSVRVAERLALQTSDPAGGEILPEPKRRFIAQSLSCSFSHRLEMTEILLKGRKTLTHPSTANKCHRHRNHGLNTYILRSKFQYLTNVWFTLHNIGPWRFDAWFR